VISSNHEKVETRKEKKKDEWRNGEKEVTAAVVI